MRNSFSNAYTLYIFDDADMIFTHREKDINIDDKIILKFFMTILDGITTLKNSIVIFTTNYPERLDPALIRCGRIDHHFEFKELPEENLQKILKIAYPENDKKINNLSLKPTKISKFMNQIIVPNLMSFDNCLKSIKEFYKID